MEEKRSDNEYVNQIKFYLKLLQFIKRDEIDDDELYKLFIFMDNAINKKQQPYNILYSMNDIVNTICDRIENVVEENVVEEEEFIPAEIEIIPNPIIEIPKNELLKLAYIREAKNITIQNNKIIYKTKKFFFNNIYVEKQTDEIIIEMKNFLEKRMISQIPSVIIFTGYSNSGKSTLSNNLCILIKDIIYYKLYEIYLNKLYIFHSGKKIELNDINEMNNKKYLFQSNNIMDVLHRFSIKRETPNNKMSSRSHCILELYDSNGTCIKLIDLAGNEKYFDTKKNIFGKMKTISNDETKYINQSLFNVNSKLANKNFHNNKCILTQIMKYIQNIIFVVLMNDNGQNCASNLLNTFQEILKK